MRVGQPILDFGVQFDKLTVRAEVQNLKLLLNS
jgi:hypothetical protein